MQYSALPSDKTRGDVEWIIPEDDIVVGAEKFSRIQSLFISIKTKA
jgi:hypothetical protein